MRRLIPKNYLCRSVPRFSRLVSSVLILRLVLYHGLHGSPAVHICGYRSVAPLYPEQFLLYCSWAQRSSSFWNNSQSAVYLSLSEPDYRGPCRHHRSCHGCQCIGCNNLHGTTGGLSLAVIIPSRRRCAMRIRQSFIEKLSMNAVQSLVFSHHGAS